ncbi:MAG: hypothetical protein FI695_02780 [SAR202 cluster bacterium]|nr:hypothetical protein [Chloroflexota bacterium]MQG50886.1 hypothetical protein [SAR202 cluster bacterium]|tara:strand:- start:5791 stop:6375 length:585 start_codon:yes stop_codon:yes gene_type:complete
MQILKNKQRLVALSLVSSLFLFILACGSEGPTGAQGSAGPQGSQGGPGPQGAAGPQGPQGVAGADGATGADGAKGEVGDTLPVSIVATVVDENGDTSNLQPVIVEPAQYQPNVIIYGSGFPAGEVFLAEAIGPSGLQSALVRRNDTDFTIRDNGTFKQEVRTANPLTLDAGLYSIVVTTQSGITASTPLLIVEK